MQRHKQREPVAGWAACRRRVKFRPSVGKCPKLVWACAGFTIFSISFFAVSSNNLHWDYPWSYDCPSVSSEVSFDWRHKCEFGNPRGVMEVPENLLLGGVVVRGHQWHTFLPRKPKFFFCMLHLHWLFGWRCSLYQHLIRSSSFCKSKSGTHASTERPDMGVYLEGTSWQSKCRLMDCIRNAEAGGCCRCEHLAAAG